MTMPRTARRSVLSDDWQPSGRHKDFAESLGVDWQREAPKFADFHIARGSLMANWDRAWQTWCRTCVERGQATGQRFMPLLAVAAAPASFDPADAYGARAWAMALPDAAAERFNGEMRPALNGYDAVGSARAICAAAGFPLEWRGDLGPVADWLRSDISSDSVVEVIGRSTRRGSVTTLRYFDAAVRQPAGRRSA